MRLRSGSPLAFDVVEEGEIESPEARSARTIPAAWLNELADPITRVCRLPIAISGAVITGGLELAYVEFIGGVSLKDCELVGTVDFSFATFRRQADFGGSRFRSSVRFRAAKFDGYLRIPACTFEQAVELDDAQVEGALLGEGAEFRGKAGFGRVKAKALSFGPFRQGAALVRTRFHEAARFLDATVGSTCDFSGTEFLKEVNFSRLRVGADARFRAAAFDHRGQLITTGNPRLVFRGPALFMSAKIEGYADFSGAEFCDEADLTGMSVGATLALLPAMVDGHVVPVTLDGPARLAAGHFAGSVDCRGLRCGKEAALDLELAICERDVTFDSFDEGKEVLVTVLGALGLRDCTIKGNLSFHQAVIGGEADLVRLRVDGNVRAKSGATARVIFGDLDLGSAHIGGDLVFAGARFIGKARFEEAHVGHCAHFQSTVLWGGEVVCEFDDTASFRSVDVGTDLAFDGVSFRGHADLRQASIGRHLIFGRTTDGGENPWPCRFSGQNDSSYASVSGKARFDHTVFQGVTAFEGLHAEGGVEFSSARFAARANLRSVRIGGAGLFADAVFGEDVDLRQAAFDSLILQPDAVGAQAAATTFNGTVDLRGLTYKRLAADWRYLTRKMEPYDRQTYVDVANSLRAAGDDREAGEVLVARKRRELSLALDGLRRRGEFAGRPWPEALRELPRVAANLFQRYIFRYGVRPLRLLGLSIGVVLVGALVFSRPAAVERTPAAAAAAQAAHDLRSGPLSLWEALGLSLRLFIPIVEIPSGSQWAPSARRDLPCCQITYETYASAHRLAGAVLVPLGIAAVSGLLVRKEKS